MNPQFAQPKGSTSKESNKDSIARKFGCKKSEVVYAKSGQSLSGYKVIYDKVTQRAYALPSNIGAVTVTSLVDGILTHSGGTVDLGALAVLRGEFIEMTEEFSDGFTIRTKNEMIRHNNCFYRWGGSLPKIVPSTQKLENTGGISGSAWIFVKNNIGEKETYISNWVSSGEDVSNILNDLLNVYNTIILDIDVGLSSNVVNNLDSKRIIGNGNKINLLGNSFDTNKGAIELTGNYTEVSGVVFTTTTATVTPLRLGNTSYGSTDNSRRVGVRSNKCVFENTGFKGPNHGNLVIIGALYPEITYPRFVGVSQAGGNMEVLGCKGGYVSEGYAENGLLINFHGTSADGVGFPTTDFQFINCEGIMSSANLGDVGGVVGGNNNIKFSRGCSGCKIIGGKFVSISAGAFNGNDHVIAIQGCSNNTVEGVFIQMNNNGDYKSAFGISDHNVSLTDSYDNVIQNCFVQINTPGQYNRVLQIQSNAGKSIRRNKLINVSFNCYNGSNVVDAVCEQTSTTSGLVSDTQILGCTGLGVTNVLLNRTGLASTAITYLQGNRIGTVMNSYSLNSGVVRILDEPISVIVNGSGALTSAVNCSVTKTSPGVWVINSFTSMNKLAASFSSPGTGRYCVISKTNDFSWTITLYNPSAVVTEMEFNLTIG